MKWINEEQIKELFEGLTITGSESYPISYIQRLIDRLDWVEIDENSKKLYN